MSKKKISENEIWGMPCFVDKENQIVYIKCSSAITAMGIPALVEKYYPGYKGKLVTLDKLQEMQRQS